jgi:serine/threonine-protein kinase RsbW
MTTEGEVNPGDTSVVETAGGAARGTTGAGNTVTLTLPPRQSYIRLARLVAAGLANELGFDVERLDDVRLAVGEACAIAVQEGATDLVLRYRVGGDVLVIELDADLAGAPDLDDDVLALAEQVLAVACTTHRLTRGPGSVRVELTFTDGR